MLPLSIDTTFMLVACNTNDISNLTLLCLVHFVTEITIAASPVIIIIVSAS